MSLGVVASRRGLSLIIKYMIFWVLVEMTQAAGVNRYIVAP